MALHANSDLPTRKIFTVRAVGNTVIVGKTDCGKTTLVQQWGKLGYYGKLKEVIWVSPSQIKDDVKTTNKKCFKNCEISYYRAESPADLSSVLSEVSDVAQTKDEEEEPDGEGSEDGRVSEEEEEAAESDSSSSSHTEYGEKITSDRLMVFDDMTSIADKSSTFNHFLTVARKKRFSTVSIFHHFVTTHQNWIRIISNVHRLVFFKVGHAKSITNYLADYTSTETFKYTPKRAVWLPSLYTREVLFGTVGSHLLIELNDKIPVGPARVRSHTGYSPSPDVQFAYQGKRNLDSEYVTYRCDRINKLSKKSLFQISYVIGRSQAGQKISIKTKEPGEENPFDHEDQGERSKNVRKRNAVEQSGHGVKPKHRRPYYLIKRR